MIGPLTKETRYPLSEGPNRLLTDLERATGLLFKRSSPTGWEFIGETRQGFQVLTIR